MSLEEDDPALADLPSSLQRKYGIYLENAPYKARLDFLNSFEKNWNHTDYLEKKKFLQDWIKKNQINYEISEENISKDLRNILDEIHKKYGKTLYNAPFQARVEYFQTFNLRWRDIDYLDRKNFIIGWYQRNQEKLEKFKEQLRIELAENLDYQLNQMRIVDIEIPKSFGKELKDAPFELKRQYYVEMGETWTHAPVDMKELYTKKWLIENKDVYEKERNREREISNEQIRVIAEQEQNQEERDQYREEVLKRQKLRQKKEELRKKEEERRKKAFQKKVEAQRKKLENLIKNRNRR